MKTITTTVYEFDELSAKVKEKARDWFRKIDEFDDSMTIEDAKTVLAYCGLSIAKVFYTGFCKQGDGACFEGSFRAAEVDAKSLTDHAPLDTELHSIVAEFARIAALYPFASFTVRQSGHYSHENCTDFTVSITDGEYNEIDTPHTVQTEAELIEAAKRAMRWIYKGLEEAYSEQNSNDTVDDTIRLNEYTFTEDGEQFG